MDEALKREVQNLKALVAEAGKLADTPSAPEAYYQIAQKILSRRAYLSGLLVDAEQAYETRKLQLRDEEDLSVAAAENKAKTEQQYALYKKALLADNLADEQVKLLKRMLVSREEEFKSTQ